MQAAYQPRSLRLASPLPFQPSAFQEQPREVVHSAGGGPFHRTCPPCSPAFADCFRPAATRLSITAASWVHVLQPPHPPTPPSRGGTENRSVEASLMRRAIFRRGQRSPPCRWRCAALWRGGTGACGAGPIRGQALYVPATPALPGKDLKRKPGHEPQGWRERRKGEYEECGRD